MTILIVGYYGFANAGDEAILAGIVDQLRLQSPGVRLIVCSGNPKATTAAFGVMAVAWNRFAEIEPALRSADLVLIGGGGLFHDYWGADPDTLLTDRHWGIAYYAGCALLAALNGKPLMLYAVGVGPLVSDYGIRLTRAACEAASLVTVRDAASRELLLRIGISGARVRVTADPAFAFRPEPISDPRAFASAGFQLRRPLLGVAVRNWSVGVNPAFFERELAAALDLYLDRSQGSVILFPFQQLQGAHEDDRAIAQRVLEQLRPTPHAAIARDALQPSQVYAAFADCQVILGMRLHALIFAATLRIPSVALSYDPKIDALPSPAFTLDVKSIDARTLSRALIDAIPTMPASVDDLAARARETASLALQLLASPPAQPHLSADALDLLRRGISSQIRSVQDARTETEQAESRLAGFDRENQSLRAHLREREAHLTNLNTRSEAALNAALDAHRAELAQVRAATLAEVDRFRSAFENELNAQRSQKAWQLMLLFRKAYTLLFRGPKTAFLGWAAGAAIGKWGSLQEFEPRFPDISTYLPDTLRFPANAPRPPAAPQRNPPQTNRYDILILAIIDFDFRFQRPQQIAAEMARRGHRVFWISPTRFVDPSSSDPFQIVSLREHLWEVHLRCPSADIYLGELRPDHVTAMTSALAALRDEWGIGENAVLIQLPFWRRLALQMRRELGSKLLYDCMDDWETFQNMGTFNVSEEKALVGECDILVVTGAELCDKFQGQGLAPVLVRNGADFAFFAEAKPADLLPGVPHPIIGYFGAIADWIDLDLVFDVAQSRPQYSFVLIGQIFGRDTSQLQALPNVFLLGNKRYEDIPAYLLHFDACLIPFLLNQVTKSTDPVKLYEYFSLGKPVVATDMAELGQCGDLVYIGRGAEDFAQKIDQALSPPDAALRERRIHFAESNTWASRVDQLDRATSALFPPVSILIVTYNSAAFIQGCLDSVLANTAHPACEIIVVDNASIDGSRALLERYPGIKLLALSTNTGFAAANNRAAQEAAGAYLVFLNADTLVPPGWLHILLAHLDRDPSIGQICPVTNFAGNEAKINVSYSNQKQMEDFTDTRRRTERGRVLDVEVSSSVLLSRTPGRLDPCGGAGYRLRHGNV